MTGETYGPLKVLCENVVRDVYADRALIVRPGLIVGPHDPSDRFTYWPRRFDLGGDAIVPNWKDMPVQLADGRDLAEWMLRARRRPHRGRVQRLRAAPRPGRWRRLSTRASVLRVTTRRFPCGSTRRSCSSTKSMPWGELPVWLPSTSEHAGMLAVSVDRAVAAGMTFRSIDEVVTDTLAWDRTRRDEPLRGPLTAEKEADVLAKWRTKGAA